MEINQEELELILKSIQEELIKEKAEAEASESESESTDEKKKKKEAEESESESESEVSKSQVAKEVHKAEDSSPAAIPDSVDADLFQVYSGLPADDVRNHLVAAVFGSLATGGHDMSSAWTAYKSACEGTMEKSKTEALVLGQNSAEVAAAEKYVSELETQNQKLVQSNAQLEKSLKETVDRVSKMEDNFKKLSGKPQESQAATAKFVEADTMVFKAPADIVKSLQEVSTRRDLSDEDRSVISRYTLRPRMSQELNEFFKKIGTAKK